MISQLTNQTLATIFLGVVLIIGCGCGSDNLSERENMPTDDPITAIPTGRLNGHVQGIEGVKINVQVMQDDEVIASTEADDDGNYQISGIEPRTYVVQITAEGYETAERTVQVRADGSTSLDKVVLKALEIPHARVRGILFDQQTKERLKDTPIQLIANQRNTRVTLTTAAGAFVFEEVLADKPLTLKIDLDGYEKQTVTIDPIPAGETATVEIELVSIRQGGLPLGDGLMIGTKAPNFSLSDADGKIHSLSDFAGQKVVLVFNRGGG